MQRTQAVPPGNLFAQVLAAALETVGAAIDDLDDVPRLEEHPTAERVEQIKQQRVHKEIVRRLNRSLVVENSFTTLSPADIRKVVRTFRLGTENDLRLRAAVLATGVQEQLYRRLAPAYARQAAWRILSVLEAALQADEELDDTVKSGSAGRAPMTEWDTAFERELEDAIAVIEVGALALSVSRSARDATERERAAQEAYDRYRYALTCLENASPEMRQDEAWEVWRQEALAGQTEAKRRLPR